jgi:hypothetical protein
MTMLGKRAIAIQARYLTHAAPLAGNAEPARTDRDNFR